MLDITSFGYLSAAYILQVSRYPGPNSVVSVSQIIPTIAADAPIISLLSAHLGLKSGLVTNDVGNDNNGQDLMERLSNYNIQTEIKLRNDLITPQMFGIC